MYSCHPSRLTDRGGRWNPAPRIGSWMAEMLHWACAVLKEQAENTWVWFLWGFLWGGSTGATGAECCHFHLQNQSILFKWAKIVLISKLKFVQRSWKWGKSQPFPQQGADEQRIPVLCVPAVLRKPELVGRNHSQSSLDPHSVMWQMLCSSTKNTEKLTCLSSILAVECPTKLREKRTRFLDFSKYKRNWN